jgi:hypothetical protein
MAQDMVQRVPPADVIAWSALASSRTQWQQRQRLRRMQDAAQDIIADVEGLRRVADAARTTPTDSVVLWLRNRYARKA